MTPSNHVSSHASMSIPSTESYRALSSPMDPRTRDGWRTRQVALKTSSNFSVACNAAVSQRRHSAYVCSCNRCAAHHRLQYDRRESLGDTGKRHGCAAVDFSRPDGSETADRRRQSKANTHVSNS